MSYVEKRSDDVAVVRSSRPQTRRQSDEGSTDGLTDERVLLYALGCLQRDAAVVEDSFVVNDVEKHYLRFADSNERAITSDTVWEVEA